MNNDEPALCWTTKALIILAIFTRDKEKTFPGESISASYVFILNCQTRAQREGSNTVTEDMAIKIGTQMGWENVYER